jgi:hypothetical protein
MKALNNYVYAAGLLAAAEAVHMADALGLDTAVFTDVLNASSGRNVATETKLKSDVLTGRYGAGFQLGLMRKDLETAGASPPKPASTPPACRSAAALGGSGGEPRPARGQPGDPPLPRPTEGRAAMTSTTAARRSWPRPPCSPRRASARKAPRGPTGPSASSWPSPPAASPTR